MDFHKLLYTDISFLPANPKYVSNDTTISNNNNHNHNNNNNKTNHINNHNDNHTHNNNNGCKNTNNALPSSQQQLCDPNSVELKWSFRNEKVGSGIINLSNNCYMNAVLQCLTYCAPLDNYLVRQNGGHTNSCKLNSFCMLCEMEKHIKTIRNSRTPLRPSSIHQRLQYINRSFQFGRQEDAHEFLRYLIDHMCKASLMNLGLNSNKLDPRIKETTIINHIFGGYHRSQVTCLTCNSCSDTFDFFMDIILDVKNVSSLEKALEKFTQPEILQNDNAYKCNRCNKKVAAKKKFTVFKAPNVATFQLKRFDSERIFGGKITKHINYPDELDLRPYMSDYTRNSDSHKSPPLKYNLSAVLVHVGHTSNSGHYYCFIKNCDNFWYRMDDSYVGQVSRETALNQQAYILFYVKSESQQLQPSLKKIVVSSNLAIPNKSYPIPASNQNGSNNLIQHKLNFNNSNKKPYANNHQDQESSSETNHANRFSSNGSMQKIKQTGGKVTNFWNGFSSETKRKMSERDEFNMELDRGKTKKVKNKARFNLFNQPNKFQQRYY